VLGSLDEPRRHRISLHVADDGDQVPVFLDRKGLVAILPNAADRPVSAVMAPDVCGQQPMHPASEVSLAPWPNDEMNVVRQPLLCLVDQRQKPAAVLRVEEHTLPSVAPRDHVDGNASDRTSRHPRHPRMVAGGESPPNENHLAKRPFQ
jgi:hypothetical protein